MSESVQGEVKPVNEIRTSQRLDKGLKAKLEWAKGSRSEVATVRTRDRFDLIQGRPLERLELLEHLEPAAEA